MSDKLEFSKSELLSRIERGWDDFQTYLATLSPVRMTGPTDAAGWTAKDHVAHLARWEEGIVALLNRQDRVAAMGLDEATFSSHDYDVINAVIRERDADRPLDEVLRLFGDIHAQLVTRISAMSDDDLLRPYEHYQPGSGVDNPVFAYVVGNTYEHYAEHRPWIDAIVQSAR